MQLRSVTPFVPASVDSLVGNGCEGLSKHVDERKRQKGGHVTAFQTTLVPARRVSRVTSLEVVDHWCAKQMKNLAFNSAAAE